MIVKVAGSPVGLLIIQLAKQLGTHVTKVGNDRYANFIATLEVDYQHQNPVHMLADCGDVIINVAIDGVGGKGDLAMAKFDATITLFARHLPAISKSIRFQAIQPIEVISGPPYNYYSSC